VGGVNRRPTRAASLASARSGCCCPEHVLGCPRETGQAESSRLKAQSALPIPRPLILFRSFFSPPFCVYIELAGDKVLHLLQTKETPGCRVFNDEASPLFCFLLAYQIASKLWLSGYHRIILPLEEARPLVAQWPCAQDFHFPLGARDYGQLRPGCLADPRNPAGLAAGSARSALPVSRSLM
jgi:hypothetical protein